MVWLCETIYVHYDIRSDCSSSIMYCSVLCTSLSLSLSLSSVANWGLPLAALADMKKDADIISPKMTTGKLLG